MTNPTPALLRDARAFATEMLRSSGAVRRDAFRYARDYATENPEWGRVFRTRLFRLAAANRR